MAGDAEARRRHLLDRAATEVAVGVAHEAQRILAAFAGVALAADAVHRDREIFVRLFADRAERHRAGFETLDDFASRLDFLERHGRPAGVELEQRAQRGERSTLLVDRLCVFLEQPEISRSHRMLQSRDRIRVVHVELAGATPLVLAADIEIAVEIRRHFERVVVTRRSLTRDRVEADACHARWRPREVLVDHVLGQPNRLEDLRAAITLRRRDAHLGRDFRDALADRLDEVVNRGVFVDVLELAVANHPGHRRVREIRIDRARAIADQQAEMHRLARFARLDDKARSSASPFANQMMMHGPGREQRRDCRILRVHAAIRKHDYRVAGFDRV